MVLSLDFVHRPYNNAARCIIIIIIIIIIIKFREFQKLFKEIDLE